MTALNAARYALRRAGSVLNSGLYLLLAVLVGLALGRQIEERLFPIVAEFRVSNVEMIGREQLCWTLAFDKRRYATPLEFAWVATADGYPTRYTLRVWNHERGRESEGDIQGQWMMEENFLRLCAQVPAVFAGSSAIRVTGRVIYDSPWPWASIYRFPVVEWRAPL